MKQKMAMICKKIDKIDITIDFQTVDIDKTKLQHFETEKK